MPRQNTLPGMTRAEPAGARGSLWESELETSNDWYRRAALADVRKVPHNWAFISENEYLMLQRKLLPAHLARTDDGRFMQRVKSDVDFTGGGRLRDNRSFAVCFDAKQSRGERFPLANVERHQVERLRTRARAGWVSGLLLYLSDLDRAFFVPAKYLDERYTKMLADTYGKSRAPAGSASLSLDDLARHCPEIFRDPQNACWNWLPVVSKTIPYSLPSPK